MPENTTPELFTLTIPDGLSYSTPWSNDWAQSIIRQGRPDTVVKKHPCVSQDGELALQIYFLNYSRRVEAQYIFDILYWMRERNARKLGGREVLIHHLHVALKSLPQVTCDVYRGITVGAGNPNDIQCGLRGYDPTTEKDIRHDYQVGKEICWSSFTATSRSRDVAVEFAKDSQSKRTILYDHGRGDFCVLFHIRGATGTDVSNVSPNPHEQEIVLPPNTIFKVAEVKELSAEEAGAYGRGFAVDDFGQGPRGGLFIAGDFLPTPPSKQFQVLSPAVASLLPTIAAGSQNSELWRQLGQELPPKTTVVALDQCWTREACEVRAEEIENPRPPAEDPRTFEKSNFLARYRKPESIPQYQHELMAAVHGLISAYATKHSIPKADADEFFHKVQGNAFTSGGMTEALKPETLMYVAVRLWTSAEKLNDRELCGILNEAIRVDATPAIEHATTVAVAINAFCVTRRRSSAPVKWPADNRTYRGGAMPQVHRDFFQPGKTYRAPMFVASSCSESVAHKFLSYLPPATASQSPPFQEPVLWIFHFDEKLPQGRRCVHANYIDRTDGTPDEEEEFLFAPYSVFTVRSVLWEADPRVDMYDLVPHRIEVDVAPDNRTAPKELRLAPWC